VKSGLVDTNYVLRRFARLNGIESLPLKVDVTTIGGPDEFLIGLDGPKQILASDELILKAAETDEELKRLIVIWELSDG